MTRFLALATVVLFGALASPALAQAASINVSGKLSNGSFVAASATVGNQGEVSGAGVLYGVNNGYQFQYRFTISRIATANGQVSLYGNFVMGGHPVRLAATVPNGPLAFTYVINGNAYTMTGTGVVTVK